MNPEKKTVISRRELTLMKRELANLRRENKQLRESLALAREAKKPVHLRGKQAPERCPECGLLSGHSPWPTGFDAPNYTRKCNTCNQVSYSIDWTHA